MRVVIGSLNFPDMNRILTKLLPHDDIGPCPDADLVAACQEADVLVPTMARAGADVIQSSSLRLIQQYGVGLEGVDLAAATAQGIPVCNVPADVGVFNAEGTAEQAVFLMLALARRYQEAQAHLKQGPWGAPLGRALMGESALVVGLGKVGRAVAWRLKALGMKVSAVKATPQPELAAQLGLERLGGPDDLPAMLGEADFVVLALIATPQTLGLFDEALLAGMKPGAVLINVGRGAVIKEPDLLAALDAGHLAGAGLDVFASEPVDPANPLLAHPKVVAMPHTGGVTAQSFAQLGQEVADNIERLKRGEPLKHQANKV